MIASVRAGKNHQEEEVIWGLGGRSFMGHPRQKGSRLAVTAIGRGALLQVQAGVAEPQIT